MVVAASTVPGERWSANQSAMSGSTSGMPLCAINRSITMVKTTPAPSRSTTPSTMLVARAPPTPTRAVSHRNAAS